MNEVDGMRMETIDTSRTDSEWGALLDGLGIAMLHLDTSGQVLGSNRTLIEIFGDTPELLRNRWVQLIHRNDFVPLMQWIRATLAGDTEQMPVRWCRYRCLDGHYRWFETSAIARCDDSGEVRSWLITYAPAKSIENLAAREVAVQAGSEARYRALFDNSTDALLLLHDFFVVDCNDAALSLLRATRERLLGRRVVDLFLGDGSLEVERAYRVMSAPGAIYEVQGRAQRLDGSCFESHSRLVRVDLNGEVFVLDTLRDITGKLAATQSRRQMLETLDARNQSLQWLQNASALLFAQPDMHSLARTAVALLEQHYHAANSFVAMLEGNRARILERTNSPVLRDIGEVYPRYSHWDIVGRSPNNILVIDDIAGLIPEDPEIARATIDRGVKMMVLVLLMDGADELGAISLEYYEKITFNAELLGDLEIFSRTLALALGRAKHLDSVAYQAEHDPLTGLHNRAVLHQRFARRVTAGTRIALFLLDLDRFKEINDTLGHHVGDDLLRQIGPRLQENLKDRDALLCRLGGDEFAVLLIDRELDDARALACGCEILDALKRPFQVGDVQLEVGASLGVAIYPQHGDNSHELLRSADVAMYAAKRTGAGVMTYVAEFDMHSPERLRLIVDLKAGIRQRELLLHYQPKLDLRSGRIVGCEALVRWQHPRQGLLGPEHFVALAEMSDSIHALTAYVIDAACRQQRAWRESGLDVAVAVNLSARNLIDDRVIAQLEFAVGAYGIPAGGLELEITETTLMEDADRAAQLLQRVAALGVRLAVDDFGTGYSSLSHLRRLPIQALKIDRTFIAELLDKPQDAVIVQSIITLAHNLGLEVVAEGVESEAVLRILAELGCDQVQGYHLSRPLPAAELDVWLRRCRDWIPAS